MIAFEVKDMTCGHCVATITKAVKAVDGNATVRADLAAHLVTIDTRAADAAKLKAAISEAGYTPVALPATAV
ncbi:heavy-metal-associated domain-containing protein [Caenimonas terrae]|uniref:Heavy-metal-associated domain-containing protein n=1 Tax=Caenimonas terrae TaxID=696074 RepID=A0ABW0NIE3_9BURK